MFVFAAVTCGFIRAGRGSRESFSDLCIQKYSPRVHFFTVTVRKLNSVAQICHSAIQSAPKTALGTRLSDRERGASVVAAFRN